MSDKSLVKCGNSGCSQDVISPHIFCSEKCMEEWMDKEAAKPKVESIKIRKSNTKLIVFSIVFATGATLFYFLVKYKII